MQHVSRFSLAVMALLIFTALAPTANAIPNHNPGHDRQDVLVSFKQDTPNGAALITGHGGSVTRTYDNFPAVAATLPEPAIEALQNTPGVVEVEPDRHIKALDYTATEEVQNVWGVRHIRADETTASGHTGASTKVAVIDSGVDYTHADLAARFDPAERGYDVVEGDTDPMDVYGHGTHVAGSIGATADSFGAVGTAPEVQLFALRVLDDEGVGSNSDILAALDWLIDYNTDNPDDPITVTNNSYGGGSTNALESAFAELAHEHDVLHVAAAGNSGNPGGNNDSVIYPAKYDSVMAVAAHDQNNQRPNWSSTGPDIDVTAPGVSVLSTWNNDSSYANPQPFAFTDSDGNEHYYKEGSGTSMSAPHVAGIGAMARGISSGLSSQHVRSIITDTAEDIGLSQNEQGSGMVRADRVATEALAVEPAATGEVAGTVSDATGAGVADATVEVAESDVMTTSDTNGNYTLEDVQTGEQEVVVSAEGYYDMSVIVTVEEDTTITQNVILEAIQTHELGGLVRDSDGNPLSGASVTVEEAETSTSTDADGNYLFDALEEGNYQVTATMEGFEPSTQNVTLETDTQADFILQEASEDAVTISDISYSSRGGRNNDRHLEVTVTLADDTGSPVVNADVAATLSHEDGSSWDYSGSTDSNGSITFTRNNAPSGCYELDITNITADALKWGGNTPANSYCR